MRVVVRVVRVVRGVQWGARAFVWVRLRREAGQARHSPPSIHLPPPPLAASDSNPAPPSVTHPPHHHHHHHHRTPHTHHQSEHERYLTEEVFKAPIIVYDYPRGIKAFYMKLNPDGKTVAAMDVLVPKVRWAGGGGRWWAVCGVCDVWWGEGGAGACAVLSVSAGLVGKGNACRRGWSRRGERRCAAHRAGPLPARSAGPTCSPIRPACSNACHCCCPCCRSRLCCCCFTLQVGELVGGSQREDRLDVLMQRITGAVGVARAMGGSMWCGAWVGCGAGRVWRSDRIAAA